jgi:subtilisin family serine protease
MNSRFVSVFIFILVHSQILLGSANNSFIKKQLPLDNVPNIELKTPSNSEFLPDRIIIKLMPEVSASITKSSFGIISLDVALSRLSAITIEKMFPVAPPLAKADDIDLSKFYVVHFTTPVNVFSFAEEITRLDVVQYAEPWFIYKVNYTPNDPSLNLQWGLQKVKAQQAWDISQGDTSVVIGIVDSGVEWTHQDLSANIWNNPNEIPGNNVDDDNNGYVDDIHGWDFAGAQWQNIQGDNNPSPMGSNNSHGTHVAGIASAATDNSIGVAGMGFTCKILPVKCSADNDTRAPGGVGYILTGYQGIAYAAMMGADVVNCSWGGAGGSQTEQDLINFATQQGTLVCAAAGNDGTSGFFSPAGYQNVIGVAATDQNDTKASYSNYGEVVDVCAPGSSIYNTIYPNSYTYQYGTSMASPFVAGLAGLVKSHFPNYTSLQIGEQLRIACDNIDNINPSFAGQLGRGRINSYKALTDSSLPSVRMRSVAISDSFGGNGNGYPQPSETLSISCNFQNFLAPTSANAAIQLSSTNSFVTIVNGSFPLGSIGTLQTASNSATPFRVFIKSNVPQSHKVQMKLTVTDGAFTDFQTFTFLVNPTFQTHDVNKIQMTLTNNGKLGFFDFPNNTQGVGFIFNNINHLFEGGLLIGNSATKLVNVVRNPNNIQDNDFQSTNFYSLTTPGTISDQDGYTMFTDNSAPAANKIGVRVDMYSYAFSDFPNEKFILLRYDVKNTTTATLSNVYIGQFYDWDLGTASNNYTKFDATRSLGYVYDSGTNARKEYIGVRALDSAKSYRALVNQAGIDLTRAGKWNWISGGTSATTAGPADVHNVISSGPFTIPAGATLMLGFGIIAGDSSLANLQENADAAKIKWEQIKSVLNVNARNTNIPSQFALLPSFPNPFNPTTNISFILPKLSLVSVKIYNVLGEEVATLIENKKTYSGKHDVSFDASHLPSGMYIARVFTEYGIASQKLLLTK